MQKKEAYLGSQAMGRASHAKKYPTSSDLGPQIHLQHQFSQDYQH